MPAPGVSSAIAEECLRPVSSGWSHVHDGAIREVCIYTGVGGGGINGHKAAIYIW